MIPVAHQPNPPHRTPRIEAIPGPPAGSTLPRARYYRLMVHERRALRIWHGTPGERLGGERGGNGPTGFPFWTWRFSLMGPV